MTACDWLTSDDSSQQAGVGQVGGLVGGEDVWVEWDGVLCAGGCGGLRWLAGACAL